MSNGVDTTSPVQLRPNEPGKRTPWAILKSDGYMHVITASVQRYDGGIEPRGTLNVHIGCSTLISDTVREGESEWDAIRRVVTAWQAEQREKDHAEALAMICTHGNYVTCTPCEVEDGMSATPEHTPTLPEDGWGRWTVLRAGGVNDAMTGYGYVWAYNHARYISEGIAWMVGQPVRVEFTPLLNGAPRPTATGDTQVDEWTA